ncbi:MAG: DNA mismatch repair endonuclease MutL [Gemmatimonadales bacterium]
MGTIRVLPSAVADQIAAGEVVERPASVIKELVENALDAGASSVQVEIEDGGRTMVRVSDDGVGMERDDAELALNRHATSKIAVTADLVGVATYGFRGEALPAIASVSVFELETATAPGQTSGEGTRVVARGGKLESVEAVGRSPGTSVTVKRLFYNTPARRKFLRSQRAESRAAVQSLTVLALARLDVSFKLTSDGRVLLDAPRVSGVADRIASLFGRTVAEGLLPVELNTGPISVRGFVQRPAEARATGRKAFLFVNGRPFRDPFLIRAAENGYRATIPANVRPTMFLSLGISGDRVDVNVHPAKLEVRFRDRMLVERAVEEAVRQALRPMDAAAEVGIPGAISPGEQRFGYLQAATADQGFPSRQTSTELPGLELPITSESRVEGHEFLQVFNTYIVFESTDGITIVDQHSAHERVLYERTMAEMKGEGSASQRLLLPLTIDLEAEELEVVDTQKELLSTVGFEVDHFGGNSVVVHAVPNPHPRFDARRCFEDLIADLARGRLPSLNRLERFAATYACRAAVKAGQELEQGEMRTLMNYLLACDLPPHDVHGRPTIVRLPRGELERKFGRS